MYRPTLTERQRNAYRFIISYMEAHRQAPTIQEIGAALDIKSTNGVFKLLKVLEAKGVIRREPKTTRGLRIVDPEDDPLGPVPTLPLVSRTTSDTPQFLRTKPTRLLAVDSFFLPEADKPEAYLVGRADDDGMNGYGIFKGDYLLIEEVPWKTLKNGEVAAFLVRDLLLARGFHNANGKLHLRPADRTYTEQAFSPADPECHVIGRIIGMMRRF